MKRRMTMTDKYIEFRKLLKKAMAGYMKSQADFAREANIAPETLNRMLNQDVISRPSRNTLQKIAGVARNNVTFNMLAEACGYKTEKAVALTPDRAREDFREFCMFVTSTRMTVFKSVDEFMDMHITLGAKQDVSYLVHEGVKADVKKIGTKTFMGDYVSIVDVSCSVSREISLVTAFAVFYFVTDNNECIVTEATNDVDVTLKYGSDFAETAVSIRDDDLEDDTDVSILFSKDLTKRKYEQATCEERLLYAIFGETKDLHKETVHVSGIGFYLSKHIPDFAIKNFLRNHKTAFCRSDREKEIYADIVENGKSVNRAVNNYDVDTNSGAGRYMACDHCQCHMP